LRVFKRGSVYWLELVFEGKRFQKSTKERNKIKAEGIAAKFRTSLAERRVGIIERKPAPEFTQAMSAFLSWSKTEHKEHPQTYRRYVISSKALLKFSGFKRQLDEISPNHIEQFKAWRSRQKRKNTNRFLRPATVNRELACLKAMFNHALKERRDFNNPVSEVQFLPENNQQNRVVTFEEQRKYLEVATDPLKDVATLIVETGMRPEEVFKITTTNVFLDQTYLQIPFGKTKAARRRIPLTTTAHGVLKRRIAIAKGQYVFPHRKDPNRPITTVQKGHEATLRKSKVLAFRIYDLRHTWATRAAEAGMDLPTLAVLLGHSKLNMVMRYAHPQEKHQAEAVKRLEAFNAAKEIAEAEKKQKQQAVAEAVPTISPTPEEIRATTPNDTPTIN
jgi:integrase